MRWSLRDETSEVVWDNGEINGHGPAYQGAVNAFLLDAAFAMTPTGPTVTADQYDPVSAYLIIQHFGFLDDIPEDVGVPPGIYRQIEQMTNFPEGSDP